MRLFFFNGEWAIYGHSPLQAFLRCMGTSAIGNLYLDLPLFSVGPHAFNQFEGELNSNRSEIWPITNTLMAAIFEGFWVSEI